MLYCPRCSCCSAYWLLVSLVVLLLLYRHVRAWYALWLLMPLHVPTVFEHMYCNMCTSSTPENLISGMLVDDDISLYLWGWVMRVTICVQGVSSPNSIPKIRCSGIPTRVSLVLVGILVHVMVVHRAAPLSLEGPELRFGNIGQENGSVHVILQFLQPSPRPAHHRGSPMQDCPWNT